MAGNHHIGIPLFEVDGTAGDVRDVHLGNLGVLAFALAGAVHAHEEDVLGAGGLLYVVDVHQVGIEAVSGLGGVVHHMAGILHRLGVVIIHVEAHVHVLRGAAFLGRCQVQIAERGQGVGRNAVGSARHGHFIHAGELNGLVQVGENLVPDFVQGLGGPHRSLVQLAHRAQVHGHAAKVSGQVEIGVGPHEVRLTHILVLDVLVQVLHDRHVLNHGIGPVDGDVGVLIEVVQGGVGLEGGRFPSVNLLVGRFGVALRVHHVGVHVAQEHNGTGVLDIVDGVVDVVGGGKRVGVGLEEVLL